MKSVLLDNQITLHYYNMNFIASFTSFDMPSIHIISISDILIWYQTIYPKISNQNYHGKLNQREILRLYRNEFINKFCLTHNLPAPIIDIADNGKPFVKNIDHLSFNISHSKTHFAMIIGLDIGHVGIDIENIGRKNHLHNIAKRFFHKDEYALWQRSDYNERLWYKFWTIKESVLKAHGLGIRTMLNELNAVFDDETLSKGYVYHQTIGRFYFKIVQEVVQVDDLVVCLSSDRMMDKMNKI